jgi:hypothetical protein
MINTHVTRVFFVGNGAADDDVLVHLGNVVHLTAGPAHLLDEVVVRLLMG